MKTTWHWSIESEANRILQTAKNISNGFYHTHNFPLLPWSPTLKYHSSAAYLPKLDYSSLPRFWHYTKNYNIFKLPVADPHHFLPALTTKLAPLALPDPTDLNLVTLWDNHQDHILELIYSLLPKTKNQLSSITIYPTHFGTKNSFSVPTHFPAKIIIYLRQDQGLHAIVESLLSALTRYDTNHHFSAVWTEAEFLIDYLIERTPLNTYISKISPSSIMTGTIPSKRSQIKKNLLFESHKFLSTIGAPTFNHPFKTFDNQVTYNNIPLSYLTPREKDLLSLLIKSSPDLVSYDQIADLIFTDNQDFSLYTISKIVERLRKKLDRHGVSSSYLTTARNQGYYLKN